MSNQVYKNSEQRYDLANSGAQEYVLTASQAIATGQVTVLFATSFRATGQPLNLSLASGVFAFTKAGLYTISYDVNFAGSANGTNRVSHLLFTPFGLAATNVARTQIQNPAAISVSLQGSVTLYVDIGDTIQVEADAGSGGSVDIFGDTSDPRSKITIARVA